MTAAPTRPLERDGAAGARSRTGSTVLSQRLRDLEEVGVVRRRTLPPPAASAVYELTEWGLELEPVVQAMGRWAARSPSMPPSEHIGTDAFILALRTMFDHRAAAGLEATYELRLGEQTFHAQVADGRFEVERGAAERPDVVVSGNSDTLAAVIFGGRPLADALESGDLLLQGDDTALARLVAAFPLPERASAL